MYLYLCMYQSCIPVGMYAYMLTYVYIYIWMKRIYVCIYVICIDVNMYAHMSVCMYIFVRIYVSIHVSVCS